MLRYLSPGRSGTHTPASPRTPREGQPVLTLHVPNYGLIIIPAPDPPGPDGQVSDEPREDHMLHGEIEVRLDGTQPKRCKAIRVGFRTIIKLDLGSGRKNEEDVLFERKLEMTGADSEGVNLQPGSQR
jgi:hypothetical protein